MLPIEQIEGLVHIVESQATAVLLQALELVAGSVDLLAQRRVRSASSRKATATTAGGVTSPTPARNVGWRIDYFLVSFALKNSVTSAAIHADVMGSDHCPGSREIAA